MAAPKPRNWWYRQQSHAVGQKESTIKDLVSYFAFAGGPPRAGEKFRLEGEKLTVGYSHTIQQVDEDKKQFVFVTGGERIKYWLDWMIYEQQGPEKKERVHRAKAPPKSKTVRKRKPKKEEETDSAEDESKPVATATTAPTWVTNPQNSFDRWIVEKLKEKANQYPE